MSSSFLATARTLIGVSVRKLILRVGDEKVEFSNFKVIRYPMDIDSCCVINMFDEVIKEAFHERDQESSLMNCLVN